MLGAKIVELECFCMRRGAMGLGLSFGGWAEHVAVGLANFAVSGPELFFFSIMVTNNYNYKERSGERLQKFRTVRPGRCWLPGVTRVGREGEKGCRERMKYSESYAKLHESKKKVGCWTQFQGCRWRKSGKVGKVASENKQKNQKYKKNTKLFTHQGRGQQQAWLPSSS